MPGENAWVETTDTINDDGRAAVQRVLEDALERQRMHRRLDQSTRCDVARRDGARRGACPPVRTGEVVMRQWIEHNVRDPSVAPLRGEQRLELAQCAVEVDTRKTYCNERAVPAPLVWVQTRRRLRPATEIILLQNGQCCAAERLRLQAPSRHPRGASGASPSRARAISAYQV